VTGWPVGTFVRGAKLVWEGELVTPATGAPVRFHAALQSGFLRSDCNSAANGA